MEEKNLMEIVQMAENAVTETTQEWFELAEMYDKADDAGKVELFPQLQEAFWRMRSAEHTAELVRKNLQSYLVH